jgi:hypothetical protein
MRALALKECYMTYKDCELALENLPLTYANALVIHTGKHRLSPTLCITKLVT